MAACLSGVLLFGTVQATTIYSNDFDGTEFVGAGIARTLSGGGVIEGVQSFSMVGFSGNFLRNSTTGNPATPITLTLTGLPTHTSISIGGLLAVIDSWDSTDGSCCTPDLLDIFVDGTSILQATFNTVLGTVNDIIGTSLTGGTKPAGTYSDLGFNSRWGDQASDMTGDPHITHIAHSASTLEIAFRAGGAGWQGGLDESYAIDNLNVSFDGVLGTTVPEPASLVLLGLGVAGMSLGHRRVRRRS